MTQEFVPPAGVDPGEWAIEQYRRWREKHLGDPDPKPPGDLLALLASMREEPGGS